VGLKGSPVFRVVPVTLTRLGRHIWRRMVRLLERKLGTHMPEKQLEEAQKPKFEPQGVYGLVDCVVVIEILTLSVLQWLKRFENTRASKHPAVAATREDLQAIHVHAKRIKRHMRDLIHEVLGGPQVAADMPRHAELWMRIKALLMRMQPF